MCCNCCKPQSRPKLDHKALAAYFPNKDDLAIPGQSQIDWGNITNPPLLPLSTEINGGQPGTADPGLAIDGGDPFVAPDIVIDGGEIL